MIDFSKCFDRLIKYEYMQSVDTQINKTWNVVVETVVSDRCSYCQSTVGYLTVILGQERAVNEIQSQVERICEFRPFGMDEEEVGC